MIEIEDGLAIYARFVREELTEDELSEEEIRNLHRFGVFAVVEVVHRNRSRRPGNSCKKNVLDLHRVGVITGFEVVDALLDGLFGSFLITFHRRRCCTWREIFLEWINVGARQLSGGARQTSQSYGGPSNKRERVTVQFSSERHGSISLLIWSKEILNTKHRLVSLNITTMGCR